MKKKRLQDHKTTRLQVFFSNFVNLLKHVFVSFQNIENQMKVQITNKEIWKIAIPIMLGNLAQTIINFTDTAFLGHLGVIELGASMLAGLFYFVFTTIATGFAIGIQIIIARRFGEGNKERVGVIFEH